MLSSLLSLFSSRRILALSALLCAMPCAVAAPATLTSARQVHDLPARQAALAIPVHLTATVTYYQPEEQNFFVADSTGGVFVFGTQRYSLHYGDVIDLVGITKPSLRTDVSVTGPITVLRTGNRIAPQPSSFREFLAGEVDSRVITIRGTVRSASIEHHGADTLAQVQLLMPGGIVQAYIQNFSGIDLASLIDADIELSGVAAAAFNATQQIMQPRLLTHSARDLKILRPARIQPWTLPLSDIDGIEKSRFILNQSQRVRVSGRVTAYDPGYSLVIQDAEHSLSVLTRQADPLPLGSIVDVIGFADDHAYGAVLEYAQFASTGVVQQVAPKPITYRDAISGAYTDQLVTMSGQVLSVLHGDLSDTVAILDDQHTFDLVMRRSGGRDSLPDLRPGTIITARGICRVTPSTEWRKPLLFRLDLRQPDDLQIVSRPSWWTVTHLLVAIGTLLALFCAILFWVVALRRKVSLQMNQIERSITVERQRSRLLEEINSETPLEHLLQNICSTMDTLVDNTCSSCLLVGEHPSGPPAGLLVGNRSTAISNPARLQPVYERLLTDTKGLRIGLFRTGLTRAGKLSDADRETLSIGAGLANVALTQRRLYTELNHSSTHDQLTGLPNRRLCDLHLDAAIQQAAQLGRRVAVAYIDLDQFKEVNDRHGHKIGDLYLQQIAARLGGAVRSPDMLARIGGDEFLLIVPNIHHARHGDAYKARLRTCFDAPFQLDDVQISGAASIGLALFPDHGRTPEELKRHADEEMYAAKRRNRSDFAGKQPQAEIFAIADLKAAFNAGQFRLHYQPQFSPEGRLRGLEALIRLHDPILGVIEPDAFIGLAERSDLILPLGDWVLRQALADAARWSIGTGEDVRIVVNVSPRQIEQPTFAQQVADALADTGMPATCLELEVTERTAVYDINTASRQLTLLRASGVHIAIDDFGSGSSSLTMLYKLPFDTLKIDKSFVRAMLAQAEVIPIIRDIVELGSRLGKRLIAEGVENHAEIAALLELGQMDLQGFAFSRPLPPEEIAANLAEWRLGLTVTQSPENA